MSEWLYDSKLAAERDDVYEGNSLNVARVGDKWMLYRFIAEASHEWIVLDNEAMDELRDYFAKFYAEDREKIAAVREP